MPNTTRKRKLKVSSNSADESSQEKGVKHISKEDDSQELAAIAASSGNGKQNRSKRKSKDSSGKEKSKLSNKSVNQNAKEANANDASLITPVKRTRRGSRVFVPVACPVLGQDGHHYWPIFYNLRASF